MNTHLGEIAKAVASGAHAIPVPDGAGWHGTKALNVPDNITLLPLPPYAPDLDPVENIRAYLRANKLAIPVFETCDEVVMPAARSGISSQRPRRNPVNRNP